MRSNNHKHHSQEPEKKTKDVIPPTNLTRLRELWDKLWKGFLAFAAIIGFIAVVVGFLTDIAVAPSITYDASDPFKQRFLITNNSLFTLNDVHYTCAITYADVPLPQRMQSLGEFIPVMIPFAGNVPELASKEPTSTHCDYIAKYGSRLHSVRIAINVFYKIGIDPFQMQQHTRGYKFSAERDSSGKFVWDYASPDTDPLDAAAKPGEPETVLIIPFIGDPPINQMPPKAQQLFQDTTVVAKVLKMQKRRIVVSTVPPEGAYLDETTLSPGQ